MSAILKSLRGSKREPLVAANCVVMTHPSRGPTVRHFLKSTTLSPLGRLVKILCSTPPRFVQTAIVR